MRATAPDRGTRPPRRANAMSLEDKQRRRNELLAGARTLFHRSGELPAVADIAHATGLAKGTVYLYFRTKEEIFVALLDDDFARLMQALGDTIARLPADPALAASALAQGFVDTLSTLPDLLPLAALAHGVLERNLPVAAMRDFKSELAARLSASGLALSQRVPGLSPSAGNTLLLHGWAMALGLTQSLRIPAALEQALQGPAFAVLRRDPDAELRHALAALWRGHLATAAAG